MRPNETELVKFLVNKLEEKHQEIVKMAVKSAEQEIEIVRNNWNQRCGELERKLEFVSQRYIADGFICDESRKIFDEYKGDIPIKEPPSPGF